MLKKLYKNETKIFWIDAEGVRHEGCPEWLMGNVTGLRGDVTGLSGDVTGLRGDVTGLSGDVTWLSGDVTGLSGDVTGLSGDVTGLRGDVDSCELTKAERKKGINIQELVEQS